MNFKLAEKIWRISLAFLLISGTNSDFFENWMGRLPAALRFLPLNTMAIPGSHDSFSSGLTNRLSVDWWMAIGDTAYDLFDYYGGEVMEAIIDDLVQAKQEENVPLWEWVEHKASPVLVPLFKPWAITQRLNITEQLMRGVRFFDLRICRDRRQVRTCHSLTGPELFDIFRHEFLPFLQTHPKEVVLIYLQNFYDINGSLFQQIMQKIIDILGDRMLPYPEPNGKMLKRNISYITIDYMWRIRKQVIMFFKREEFSLGNMFWPWNYTLFTVYPTLEDANNPGVSVKGILNSQEYYTRCGRYFQKQWMLTTPPQFELYDMFATRAPNFELFSEPFLKSFTFTIANQIFRDSYYCGRLGIYSMDYVEKYDFIPRTIRLNFECNRKRLGPDFSFAIFERNAAGRNSIEPDYMPESACPEITNARIFYETAIAGDPKELIGCKTLRCKSLQAEYERQKARNASIIGQYQRG